MAADGSYTYTPDPGFDGDDQFLVEISDGIASINRTVFVTVVGPGSPLAVDDRYTTVRNGELIVDAPGVLTNDVGVGSGGPGDGPRPSLLVAQPLHGQVVLAPTGALVYAPEPGFVGTDTFSYLLGDTDPDDQVDDRSNSATVWVTVLPTPNAAPVAIDDVFVTQPDDPLLLDPPGLLANDVDPDGDQLTVGSWTEPLHGAFSLSAAGGLSYTPDPGYVGTDSFTYRASDGAELSEPATVTLIVGPLSPGVPRALDDRFTTGAGRRLRIGVPGVLQNDIDPEDGDLTATLVDAPLHGVVALRPDGSFDYTPTGTYVGEDHFTYSASDGLQTSTAARVTIAVTGASARSGTTDRYRVEPDGVKEVTAPGVLANDVAVGSGPTTAELEDEPEHGSVAFADDGSFTYVPDIGFRGTDGFTYRAISGSEASSPVEVILDVKAAAEGPDSRGREAWLAFMPNQGDSAADRTVFVTAEYNSRVTVSMPGRGFAAELLVTGGEVASVVLPSPETRPEGGYAGVYPDAVHVLADEEVTVYGLNQEYVSTDAFLALPADVLGRRYVGMAYPGRSQLAVVATQDGTQVDVDPRDETGVLDPIHVELDAGEVYEWQLDGDHTGMTVVSSAPVAVFGGNRCINIAVIFACDHLAEQLHPTATAGTRFATEPLATRATDLFRVTATADDTVVTIDGVEVATLDLGSHHEVFLSKPSLIETDRPVMVAQFSLSGDADGTTADPFMVLLVPVDQFLDGYTLTTPPVGFARNYLNLVVPEAAAATVVLDGVAVPSDLFHPIGSSGYSGAQIPVPLGSHRVEAGAPFGVTAYGFNLYESYGYVGGMALSTTNPVADLALDPPREDVTVGSTSCVTATVTMAGAVLAGAEVVFSVRGAHTVDLAKTTGTDGQARFCYRGGRTGLDTVTASIVDGTAIPVTKRWRRTAAATTTTTASTTTTDPAATTTTTTTDPAATTTTTASTTTTAPSTTTVPTTTTAQTTTTTTAQTTTTTTAPTTTTSTAQTTTTTTTTAQTTTSTLGPTTTLLPATTTIPDTVTTSAPSTTRVDQPTTTRPPTGDQSSTTGTTDPAENPGVPAPPVTGSPGQSTSSDPLVTTLVVPGAAASPSSGPDGEVAGDSGSSGPSGSAGGELSRTGVDFGPLLVMAVAIVSLGGLAAAVARRRMQGRRWPGR